MRNPTLARLATLVCTALLLLQAGQVLAQSPAAAPGQGGVPGATPGTPGQIDPSGGQKGQPGGGQPGGTQPGSTQSGGTQPGGTQPGGGRGDWTLSDLLDGIVAMDKAGLPLTSEQAAKIRPALQRVIDASTVISDTEKAMQTVLTPSQLRYIEEAQRSGKLNSAVTGGKPSRPGEDPVVSHVIDLLEKKAK